MTSKPTVKSTSAKTLTNNTKGLRHIAGVKVLPGKTVTLTDAQEKSVNANKVALAWIEKGDFTLK